MWSISSSTSRSKASGAVRLVIDGVDTDVVDVAATPATRRRGLLHRDGIEGAMWFPGVRSVHTLGMRFTIDVAHVDRHGVVISAQTMVPNRLGAWRSGAAGVLEASGGAFGDWNLLRGSRIRVGPWPAN